MISFDVVSLFTNVPIDEALHVIKDKLTEDDTLFERTGIPIDSIMELLTLCLKTTAFQLDDQFFKQTEGIAMGSPLSPIVANIYMEYFEQMALNSFPLAPLTWLRYVDDTWLLWDHGEENAQALLHHLNSLRGSIKFTMEIEEEESIAFLDVKVKKLTTGFITSVYKKPTNTDLYLHFDSHHPAHVKKGIVKCLHTRASTINNVPENEKKELDDISFTLSRNGYPSAFTKPRKTIRPVPSNRNEENPLTTIRLPYSKGVSEDIKKVCKQFNIRCVFKSQPTLRQILTKTKPKMDKNNKKNIIYQVPCRCGKLYIGETKRPLKTRIEEHKSALRTGETSRSHIAVHAWEDGEHGPKWDDTKIIDHEEKWLPRKFKEAAHMSVVRNNYGRPSFEIPTVWMPLIKKAIG